MKILKLRQFRRVRLGDRVEARVENIVRAWMASPNDRRRREILGPQFNDISRGELMARYAQLKAKARATAERTTGIKIRHSFTWFGGT